MAAQTWTDRPEAAPHPHHHHGWWWKTLLTGLALWILTIVVTIVTGNTNLIPTLILLGSFLVPFCVVLFAIERVSGSVSSLQLVLAFFIGGIFGVLGASLLEVNLHQSYWLYLLVGLIEELVKGILLVIIGWRVVPKTATQGALLGATVGAGFAAFESAGYAFNAAITARGIDLVSLLQTEVLRAILAPVGHVLWTAVLGAVSPQSASTSASTETTSPRLSTRAARSARSRPVGSPTSRPESSKTWNGPRILSSTCPPAGAERSTLPRLRPTRSLPVLTAFWMRDCSPGGSHQAAIVSSRPSLAHRTIDVRLQRARSSRRMETSST